MPCGPSRYRAAPAACARSYKGPCEAELSQALWSQPTTWLAQTAGRAPVGATQAPMLAQAAVWWLQAAQTIRLWMAGPHHQPPLLASPPSSETSHNRGQCRRFSQNLRIVWRLARRRGASPLSPRTTVWQRGEMATTLIRQTLAITVTEASNAIGPSGAAGGTFSRLSVAYGSNRRLWLRIG